MTERELIEGCIRKDRIAQRALFDRFAGKMLTVCRRYTRHHLEAEDILQDAFIKVFSNIHRFEFKGSFEGWVRRVVVNTALKNYSKSSFQKESIGLEDYQDQPIEAQAVSNLGAEELLTEINRLPDGYRLVFNLYVLEGYSHKEIGEQLNIGESTSRSQLTKARKMLQDRITKNQFIAL